MLSVQVQPFYLPLYNSIDQRLNFAVLAILLVGGAFFFEGSSSSANGVLFGLLILALVVFFVLSCSSIYQDARMVLRARDSVTATSARRKVHFSGLVMEELRDFESDPELLRHAAQFLSTLDSTTELRSSSALPTLRTKTETISPRPVAMDSIDFELGEDAFSSEILLGSLDKQEE